MKKALMTASVASMLDNFNRSNIKLLSIFIRKTGRIVDMAQNVSDRLIGSFAIFKSDLVEKDFISSMKL